MSCTSAVRFTSQSRPASQVVALFGSYGPRPGEPLYEQAYSVGFALAQAGYTVCNGGYDGTMEASAKGARDAGGATIGVTCDIFSRYRDIPLKANAYIDREILHQDVFTRVREMMDLASGYVILEGGTGTLVEFGVVWEFVCKKLIAPRPIFVVGDFWKPLVDRLVAARPKSGTHVHCVHTAEQIVKILARYAATAPDTRRCDTTVSPL